MKQTLAALATLVILLSAPPSLADPREAIGYAKAKFEDDLIPFLSPRYATGVYVNAIVARSWGGGETRDAPTTVFIEGFAAGGPLLPLEIGDLSIEPVDGPALVSGLDAGNQLLMDPWAYLAEHGKWMRDWDNFLEKNFPTIELYSSEGVVEIAFMIRERRQRDILPAKDGTGLKLSYGAEGLKPGVTLDADKAVVFGGPDRWRFEVRGSYVEKANDDGGQPVVKLSLKTELKGDDRLVSPIEVGGDLTAFEKAVSQQMIGEFLRLMRQR